MNEQGHITASQNIESADTNRYEIAGAAVVEELATSLNGLSETEARANR